MQTVQMPNKLKFTSISILSILIGVSFYFYISLLKTRMGSLSSVMIDKYSITTGELAFMTSVFYLISVLLKFPAGVIVDKYSPRIPLVVSMGFTVVGCFLFSMSETAFWFTISRGLFAVGYRFSFISAVKIIVKYTDHKIYSIMIGLVLFLGIWEHQLGAFHYQPCFILLIFMLHL